MPPRLAGEPLAGYKGVAGIRNLPTSTEISIAICLFDVLFG
jgi:hypothetical protein